MASKLGKALLATYGTYLGANWLSNTLDHPVQKLDYGVINKWTGKPCQNLWWGTRTEHLFVIPATLTVADHSLQAFWNKAFLPRFNITQAMSWKTTPKTFLVHLYGFAVLGIMAFNAQDAMFNPALEGKRMESFKQTLFPTAVGSGLQWQVSMVDDFVRGVFRNPSGPFGFLVGILGPTTAFMAVKVGGFSDYGETGLTAFERKLNGLKSKEEEQKAKDKKKA